MNYYKQIAWAVMLGIMSVATPPIWAQSGVHTEGTGHRMLTPGDLTWVEVPSLPPGAKLALIEGPLNEPVPFTFRLQFPANYQIPAHWHPAVERVTVISGTVNMGIGNKEDSCHADHHNLSRRFWRRSGIGRNCGPGSWLPLCRA